MTRYVSLANLMSWFMRVTSLKSPTLATCATGPMPEPQMMLVVMDFSVDV
jgi:hypothetical protein